MHHISTERAGNVFQNVGRCGSQYITFKIINNEQLLLFLCSIIIKSRMYFLKTCLFISFHVIKDRFYSSWYEENKRNIAIYKERRTKMLKEKTNVKDNWTGSTIFLSLYFIIFFSKCMNGKKYLYIFTKLNIFSVYQHEDFFVGIRGVAVVMCM